MTKKKPQEAEPHELILDHLRALRGDVSSIKAKQFDHDKKFLLIERRLTSIHRDIADILEMFTDKDARHLSVEERLDRLERHAGLTDTLKQ